MDLIVSLSIMYLITTQYNGLNCDSWHGIMDLIGALRTNNNQYYYTQHEYSVSLFGMLNVAFLYYYAECCNAECRYAECCYAECCYAESRYAECRYAECRYAECRGASLIIQLILIGHSQ
jgi:hypothetical protein